MRQILETEFDTNFFRLGQAAIKSFLKHNPGWEIHVCDIGLTAEQRKELEAVATVECNTSLAGTGRWPQSLAKLATLAKLCALPDTLILHIDADTLTFGSVDPLVAEMQRANIPIMMLPIKATMSGRLCSFAKTRQIYKEPENWFSHHCYTDGVAAMTASPQLASIFERTSEKYTKYRGLFRAANQTALNAELLDAGTMIINLPACYNFTPAGGNKDAVALFNPPILDDGTELVIMHIPFPKSLIFAAGAPRYAVGWWWKQWLKRYEEEPWPTTA